VPSASPGPVAPDAEGIRAILDREYGLRVSAVSPIREGNEGVKFLAHGQDVDYFVKVMPASDARAMRFAASATQALSQRGFRHAAAPLAPLHGAIVAELEGNAVEVRLFLDGVGIETLPPTDELLCDVGRVLGELHATGRHVVFDDPVTDAGPSFTEQVDALLEAAAAIAARDPRRAAADLVVDNRLALKGGARSVDSLRGAVDDARDRWVITHGDSRGNAIVDPGGRIYFIDWTAAAMTPPERDVVHYATAGFEAFLAGYRTEASIDSLSVPIATYYVERWQIEGATYYGKRLFLGDPRGDCDAPNEAVLRMFVPYRSDTVGESLAVLRRCIGDRYRF
jgi:Ser/Thr protein kinase RdoA (MazF antagonist)